MTATATRTYGLEDYEAAPDAPGQGDFGLEEYEAAEQAAQPTDFGLEEFETAEAAASLPEPPAQAGKITTPSPFSYERAAQEIRAFSQRQISPEQEATVSRRNERWAILNFFNTAAHTAAQMGLGVAGIGAKLNELIREVAPNYPGMLPEDLAEIEEDVTQYYQPKGGVSGALGEAWGTVITLIPSLVSGDVSILTKMVPILFGLSETGSTLTDIAKERAAGRTISPTEEYATSIANGVIEWGFETLGMRWIQRGITAMGGKIGLIQSAKVAAKGGTKQVLKWVLSKAVILLGNAGQQAGEEAATALFQGIATRGIPGAPEIPIGYKKGAERGQAEPDWGALPGEIGRAAALGALATGGMIPIGMMAQASAEAALVEPRGPEPTVEPAVEPEPTPEAKEITDAEEIARQAGEARPGERVDRGEEEGIRPLDVAEGAAAEEVAKQPWEMTKKAFEQQESLTPAIRFTDTGEVVIGKVGEIHAAILDRWSLGGRKKFNTSAVESGWADRSGKYIEYGDAEKYQKDKDALRNRKAIRDEHEAAVTIAFAQGKPVPAEVLAEYPDLAAPKEAAPAKAPAEMTKADLDYDRNPDAADNSDRLNAEMVGKGPKVGDTFAWPGDRTATIAKVQTEKTTLNKYGEREDLFTVEVSEAALRLPGTKGGAAKTVPGMTLADMVRQGLELEAPPTPAKAAVEAGEKQPWEMTQGTYLESTMRQPKGRSKQAKAARQQNINWHTQLVGQALAEGKPVPAEVLADYPELAKPAPKPAKVAEPVSVAEGAPPTEPGIAPAEAAPAGAEPTTSIKLGSVAEARAKRDLPPVPETPAETKQAWIDQAREQIEKDPALPTRIVTEQTTNPRALKPVEVAVLQVHRRTVTSAYEDASNKFFDAVEAKDDVAKEEARRAVEVYDLELQAMEEASRAAGAVWARSGIARQLELRQDYSLAAMIRRARVANEGKPLTDKQLARIKKQADKIAELERQLEVALKRGVGEATEKDVDQFIRHAKKRRRGVKPKRTSKGVAAGIRAAVREGRSLADLHRAIQLLSERLVAEGIDTREGLIDAVHEILVSIDPTITRRDAMDAISGYGLFRPLNKDAIKAQLRDLQGQMQQVAKLQDMEAKRAPAKTGAERRTPSAEERRLIKLVNEAKREGGFVVTDPETQLKSALDSLKTRLRHQIADLELQLRTGERILAKRTSVLRDAEVQALTQQRDALKEQFDSVFGTRELTDEQRIELAKKAVGRSIAEYERRIKERDLFPGRPVSKTPTTAELQAMRARREALKQELKELQGLADIADPSRLEAIRNQSFATRTAKRIADLQERIAREDYVVGAKRVPLGLTAANLELQHELERTKAEYHKGVYLLKLKNRSKPMKIIGAVGEVFNTARAIMTSFDLSAVMRQGGFIGLAHPVRAAKSIPAMLRAMVSEKQRFAVEQEIHNRPNAALYKSSGLYLSQRGGALSKMEETYMSRWAEKIPGVAASERAFTTFLDKLRADSFDAMVKSLGRNGEVTQAEAQAIANFINVATGRGSLGARANAQTVLSTVFFAPRLVASRFQLLAAQPFYGGTARTRVMMAAEYARFLAGIGIIFGLVALTPDEWEWEIELDPRSSNFGKIRVGKTRIDMLTGLSQTAVFISRLLTGERKTQRGKVVPIRGKDVPYGSGNAADVIARFLRSKLSPVSGTFVNLFAGQDFIGRPVTVGTTVENLATPMAMRDIYEAMREHGVPHATAVGLLAIFGVGIQTYEARGARAGRAARPSRPERAKRPSR